MQGLEAGDSDVPSAAIIIDIQIWGFTMGRERTTWRGDSYVIIWGPGLGPSAIEDPARNRMASRDSMGRNLELTGGKPSPSSG